VLRAGEGRLLAGLFHGRASLPVTGANGVGVRLDSREPHSVAETARARADGRVSAGFVRRTQEKLIWIGQVDRG